MSDYLEKLEPIAPTAFYETILGRSEAVAYLISEVYSFPRLNFGCHSIFYFPIVTAFHAKFSSFFIHIIFCYV